MESVTRPRAPRHLEGPNPGPWAELGERCRADTRPGILHADQRT